MQGSQRFQIVHREFANQKSSGLGDKVRRLHKMKAKSRSMHRANTFFLSVACFLGMLGAFWFPLRTKVRF
jgi:hypothetical protein